MRFLLFLAVTTLSITTAFSQSNDFKWQSSFKTERAFIENQGQFDRFEKHTGEEIHFAIEEGKNLIVFTESGYSIILTEKVKNKNRERGDRTKSRYLEEVEVVTVTFDGVSKDVTLKTGNPLTHNSVYASLNLDKSQRFFENVKSFESIIYKNVYEGIDLKFTIHPEGGFKYDISVAPFADPNQIKLRYDDQHQPFISNKNVLIATRNSSIIDHAPKSYLSGYQKIIESYFVVDGNRVQFEIADYDQSQELTIDPWVLTPSYPNSGGIWDIDTDDLGNVYVWGGDTPMKLQKYDDAGNLQWTYNSPWDSVNYWIGTMITDPVSGDSYITAGTDPVISRVSTAGAPIWTANGGPFDEYWKLAFNCDNTRLIVGGTRLSLSGGTNIDGYGYVFEVDINNGSQIAQQEIASNTPGPVGLIDNPNEVRAMCPSANGKYYYMTLDTIGVFDENLTLGYKDNHGYQFSYQVAGYGVTNQSINAMAATTDFIYTTNGTLLEKRNIVDGSIIQSTTIPNGLTSNELGFNSAENGGLELDSCGNVYVGSTDGVYKFDEDLNQLLFQATPGRVYDVAVNNAGEVVACGQGFVASLNLEPCAPPKQVCLECLELTPAGPFCPEDDPVTLVAEPENGVWSGPGIVDPVLGVFDPSVADTGTHVVFFAPEIPLQCGADSLVIEVNFCVDLTACQDSLGRITVPNGIGPFTWSETIDTLDCSGCFPGFPPFIEPCSTPPGCAIPTTAVQVFSTDDAVTPTGNWPILVEDSEGNTLQINALSEVPACEEGCFITANLPDTIIACTGDSGEVAVQVVGGFGNLSYSWNTIPEQTTPIAVDLVPGSYYTVTVTDDSACVAIDSVYVLEEECIGPIICATPFGDMQASGIAPFEWFELVDSTDCSDCAPAFPPFIQPCSTPPGCQVIIQEYQSFATGDLVAPTGSWPIAVVDGAGDTTFISSFEELPLCTQDCYLTVNVPDTFSNCFGVTDAQITANAAGQFGQVAYSWSTSPIQTTATISNVGSGEYVITVTDENLCEATDTVVVVENPEIELQVSGTDSICLGISTGTATATASGGVGVLTYSWNTTPEQTTVTATNLEVGVYEVTVTDESGCTETGGWTIEEEPSVVVAVTSSGNVCPGEETAEATASASNGVGPYTYTWTTMPPQSGETASSLGAGDYQVIAEDQDGCQGLGTITIVSFPEVIADAGDFTIICFGDSTELVASGGVNYNWSTGETAQSIVVNPTESTLYTVLVTDANSCEASDTVTVAVSPIPEVSIEEIDSLVCDVEPPFMIVGIPPGGTFSGTGISTNGFFEPLVAGNGVHQLTYTYVTDDNCEADTTFTIEVDETLCDVSTPSVFNPNSSFEGEEDFCGNTPQNNVFALPCLELYPGNQVTIYDRWGRKHYERENYHLEPWDGGNHSDGVYYYIIELPNEDPIKGFFHLVR